MSAIIGAESVLTPPASVDWSSIVNFRPGDGATATTNPPRFSWFYTPAPEDCETDAAEKRFRFQVADNGSFTSPDVDLITDLNFYNFLAPLAEGTWYWRVGYCGLDEVVDEWSATRTFVVDGSSVSWDRSDLADDTYLASKAAHPHIGFTSATHAATYAWLEANNPNNDWGLCKFFADTIVATSWYIAGAQPDPATVMDVGTWANKLGYVSLSAALSEDSDYTTGLAAQLELLADWYLGDDGPNQDDVSDSNAYAAFTTLAVAYDWNYALLSTPQKAKLLSCLSQRCAAQLVHTRWFKDDFSGTTVEYWSCAKRGDSHGFYNASRTMLGALAAFGDDADCRAMFDAGMNYMIGVTYPFGYEGTQNQGRGYGLDQLFVGGSALMTHMMAHLIFPEAGLTKNPFWATNVEWWDRFLPVAQAKTSDPWGEGSGTITSWGNVHFGRDLARFTGSTVAQRHYVNQLALPPTSGTPAQETFLTIPFAYAFSTPSQSSSTPGGVLYPDGWAISNSHTTSTDSGFRDGCGMIFQARPRGGEVGHSNFSDGAFELWAYGATITDGGDNDSVYSKIPYSNYCLLVNGLGVCQKFSAPQVARYSEFVAFKEATDFTYVCADLTKAYPRLSFTPSGYRLPNDFVTNHSGAPLAALTKVRRHILFVRKKYWVIFDGLASGAASTFSWLYHILPNTATVDGSAKRFSYTVPNLDAADVTVHVAHIGTGAGITLTNLTGTDVAKNPITLEDYYSVSVAHRSNAIWVSNSSPSTTFNFLTVIVPVAPAGSDPVITRLDDKTVSVALDGDTDVISFDADTAQPYTLLVSLATPGETGTSGSIVATTANFGTLTIG